MRAFSRWYFIIINHCQFLKIDLTLTQTFYVMDQEKHTLTWHTYSEHLQRTMREMMVTNNFTDVTLVTDDKKLFKAHRSILVACSPVLKDILQIQNQNNHPVIYLRGIEYSEIESIMQFIYLGETKVCKERMKELIKVAKNLEITQLSNEVEVGKPENDSPELGQELADECFNESNESISESDGESNSIYKDLLQKLLQEAEVKGSKFVCPKCDKVFSFKGGLAQHIKSVHEGAKYACNQCDKEFSQISSRTVHIQSAHEGVRYTCTQCGYLAPYHSRLLRHIRSVHEGVKYACNQCNKQFSPQHLPRHIQSVHEGIKYNCYQCGKQFNRQDNLTTHIRSMHNEDIKYD